MPLTRHELANYVYWRLLEQVWEINEQQKEILFRKLWNYYHCDLNGKTVAIR
jgi:UDPglucose 6-dehydrogenase